MHENRPYDFVVERQMPAGDWDRLLVTTEMDWALRFAERTKNKYGSVRIVRLNIQGRPRVIWERF